MCIYKMIFQVKNNKYFWIFMCLGVFSNRFVHFSEGARGCLKIKYKGVRWFDTNAFLLFDPWDCSSG